MEKQIINKQLLSYYDEINSWLPFGNRSGSVLEVFFAGKAHEFMKMNKGRVDSVVNELKGVAIDYVQHTIDIKTKEPQFLYDGEGQDQMPRMKEGKTIEEYSKIIGEINNRPVIIDV